MVHLESGGIFSITYYHQIRPFAATLWFSQADFHSSYQHLYYYKIHKDISVVLPKGKNHDFTLLNSQAVLFMVQMRYDEHLILPERSKMMKKYPLLMVLCLLFAYTGNTQPIGIFDASVEIGEPADIGFVEFSDGMYEIEGVGATAGRNVYNDQFSLFTRSDGSFSIEGSPEPLSDGEVGLMIRNSLEPNAAHISFLMSGGTPPGGNTNAVNGSVFPYIRSLDGGGTIVDGDIEADNVFIGNHMGPIRLVRLGNSVHFIPSEAKLGMFQSEAAFTDRFIQA